MAIIDGRRVAGVVFYKVKGRNEWLAHRTFKNGTHGTSSEIIGAVAEVNTRDDPRKEMFHYCSPIAQPVFLDSSVGHPNHNYVTPSSWKKMPEGWRAAFRDYLDLPEQAPKGAQP